MKKYKLTISYDGTNFGGWQIQPNSTCIQALIQDALTTILRAPIRITGAGRTDAGVHALAQVAHFSYLGDINLNKTLVSLNALLPTEIRIHNIEEVPMDFHARYSATHKVYHYHFHLDRSMHPFRRLYSAHILHPVDLDLLKEAATYFLGTHDFTSFANEANTGSAAKNAIRTLHRLDVHEEDGVFRLEFEGDGFLYKMVRNIVGTLLDISRGKIPLSELPAIFEAKDRRKGGKTAPPQGLFLMQVHYPKSLKDKQCCTSMSGRHSS